jgi:Ran GTPase-activating protein (RanGAP) involved in mRNA processing and transport
MDRLVAALDRRQHPRQGLQQHQHDGQNGGIEVKLCCIRPFDSDGVAFLDGFLYGNTNSISSLNISLCDLSSLPPSRYDHDDLRERDDRVVSSSSRSTAAPTTALDVICRFLANPREPQHATAALKSITFMACHLTNEHARRIVHALRFGSSRHHDPTITQLDLSRNELQGVDGGVILGEFLTLLSLQLTHLNISRNAGLGPDALQQSNLRLGLSKCKKLVKLTLHGCKLGNVGLSQLCLALDKDGPIEEFDIGDNDLQGSTAGVCLAFVVQQMMSSLISLDVSSNPQLGADGVMALGKALVHHHACRLQTLSISDCGMGNAGVECLDKVLKESLGKNNNNNGPVGIYKSMTHLHLARNNISNGAAVGSLLQPFARLQRCTLSGNPLGPGGAAELGPVVILFLGNALQHLQMTNCRLGNAGIDYMITHVFAKCPSLQTIQLGSNHDDVLYPPMMPLALIGHGQAQQQQQQQQQQYAALHYNNQNQGAPRSLPPTRPEKCAACQDYYREKAELEKLPCGRHYLHSSCLHSWHHTAAVANNNDAQQCQLCREEQKQQQSSISTAVAASPAAPAKKVVASPAPASVAKVVNRSSFAPPAMSPAAVTGHGGEEMPIAAEQQDPTTTVVAPTAAAAALQPRHEEWHSAPQNVQTAAAAQGRAARLEADDDDDDDYHDAAAVAQGRDARLEADDDDDESTERACSGNDSERAGEEEEDYSQMN